MRHYPLVQPRYEREPDSVPGPFYVAVDTCITCALPPETAPNNITWNEEFQRTGCQSCIHHCRVSRQPETDEELELMFEATYGSCVQAIRYCGTDPQTLERFQELGIPEICDALPVPPQVPSPRTTTVATPWWRFW